MTLSVLCVLTVACCVVLQSQHKNYPGPVWVDLLKWCNQFYECQEDVIYQLVAQKQQAAAVSEAQAEAAAARAEAARAHAEAAVARAAELRAQLQALQGQVQHSAQGSR